MTNSDSLLVIATGSSASITLPSYLAELRARVSLDIVVLMTETATRFVRPEVVGWFAHSVLTPTTTGLNPIDLACNSSAVVVLPASGNTLVAAALGLMATPATTVLGAAPSPCLFFPHLHHTVWRKPFLQRHVADLREQGHRVVDPQPLETFQISAQRQVLTLSMPAPGQVAEMIDDWLKE